MLNKELNQYILSITEANDVVSEELIQTLWSGYGELLRVILEGGKYDSVIVKHILFPAAANHPRGWNTNASHERKVRSYEVESYWYQNYRPDTKVPKLLAFKQLGAETTLILEDLNTLKFTERASSLSINQAKVVLNWLAHFHAQFMHVKPEGLWETGTYWHLATRQEEWMAMEAGKLKQHAKTIDDILNNCQYKTLVHGDAKVANFCFNKEFTQVSAVDFQYVGGGCGIKDVVYFLGSCLSEEECERYEEDLLNIYFEELKTQLAYYHPTIKALEVEREYRSLFSLAWTDFTRFLMGWMPTHHKLNRYSKFLMNKTLAELL